MKHILFFVLGGFMLHSSTLYSQQYTGVFKTSDGNTDYHHFTRENSSGAAVYINQVGAGPILRLSGGTATANNNVVLNVKNNGVLEMGAGSTKAIIDPALSVSNLNPGATASATSIKGKNMGHVVIDLYGNDDKDAFAVRTDADRDGELDLIPFLVNNKGNVGIGTITPDSKLSVNGVIHSKEVKVDLNGWSDFVFEENYNLLTLEEVEEHIREKGHLKDIPSAAEVAENGVYLGEMDARLLQKIEELTLYILQQEKRIKVLERQNGLIKALQKEIKALKENDVNR